MSRKRHLRTGMRVVFRKEEDRSKHPYTYTIGSIDVDRRTVILERKEDSKIHRITGVKFNHITKAA